jgi:hypothetical protein
MNADDIARYYIKAPAYEVPSSVIRDFRQFVINLAKKELRGIKIRYVDFQPYMRGEHPCQADLCADVHRGRLLISTQFNNADLLDPEANLDFRCLHEAHHVKLNAGFDWQGECAVARHIMSFTDRVIFKQLLFSEILGQSAVCLHRGQFPEHQKVVLFPEAIVQQALYN